MFIVALFIIAKLWKKHRCSAIDKWIKKRGLYIFTYLSIYLSIYLSSIYISPKGLYSAIRMNETT
jgi:hypothetical protein